MALAVQRERFNAQVSAAMATLQATTTQYVTATDKAAKRLQQIINDPDSVARHTQEAVYGNTVRAGGKPAFQGNQLTLDRWGNVLSITDPRDPNWKTTYTYNQTNQQTSGTAIGSGGKQTALQTSRYDALGRLVGTIDGRGALNQYVYDTAGNLAQEIHAEGGIVTNTYDAFGNRLSTTQPDTVLPGETLAGVTTRYSYDHLGHLLTTRTAAVNVYEAILTGFGPLPSNLVDHKEQVQRREYDELGRLIRSLGSDKTGTEQEYDGSGNVISTATVDRRNGIALHGRTLIAYDAENHKIATKDANGKSMSWLYDKGRLKTSIDMGGKATEYGYDASGRLLSQTSGYGQNLRYTYSGTNLVRIDDVGTSLSTVYAYDSAGNRVRERQVFLGNQADAAERLQNNTITFDNLNRVTQVRDDQMQLDYEYDANGNRVKIVSRYGNAEPITRFNAFDVMNRQTIVNGIWVGDEKTGYVVRGSGHAITYDKAGNRVTDTYDGTSVVTTSSGSYGYQKNAVTTETYRYDAAGRLATISRDGLLIDERHYDAGSRVSQSGLAGKGASGVADVLTALGIDSARRVYTYDVFGHITREKDLNANIDTIKDIWFVKDQWNPDGGYDAMGNLTGYSVVRNGDSRSDNGRFIVTYAHWDSYKEEKTTLANDNSVITSTYDVNGNRISIFDTKENKLRNQLWYDADGHVQSYKKDGKDAGFNLIVNGNVLGEESASADNLLGSNYMPVTSPSMVAAPSSYSVQSANETLQSIAQGLWGDGNLWYLIADANALTADSKLTVGDILRIPARVNTVHGDYDTYKPYDPSEQIGSTAPTMPPPKAKGCGVVGQVIMVVIAVAVTAMASFALGPILGQGIGGQLATLALSGAAGSIASQGAGIAMDMQDGFNWKAVGRAAISNMVGGGGGPSSSIAGAMATAALANVVTQAVSVATGLQDSFKWRNVVASAVGAGVGHEVAQYLGGSNPVANFLKGSPLTKATAVGFAAGVGAAVARGGKIEIAQIAGDAFGNALGNSVAATVSGAQSARLEADQKRSGYEEAAYEKASWAARNETSSAASSGGTWWDDNGAYPNGPRLRFFMGGPAAAGVAGADRQSDRAPLAVANVLGASAIVDGMPQIIVPGPGPSWIERNILHPLGHIASDVGNVLADVGKGFLKLAEDTFVRPSGSTDEIPQNFKYSYPSQGGWDSGYRPLSSYRPVGPAFVALDPAKEAMSRVQAQRVSNNLAMSFGGPFVALPMLAARGVGGNETLVGEAGYLGASLQEIAGVRGSGMRFPSAQISGAPAISLSISARNRLGTNATVELSPGAALRQKWGHLSQEERFVLMNQQAEKLAFDRLSVMEKERGAHFLEKHGAQLDLQWQFDRASGLKGYEPPSATRFFNSRDQVTAIERAELIYARTGRKDLAEAPMRFDYPVGSGYKGGTLEYGISYSVRTNIRSATGQAYTSFPRWNQ